MRQLPIGQVIHSTLISDGKEAAAALARAQGQLSLFERVTQVAAEDPTPNFLHSALCAMSLPVRKPSDDKVPILRHDGQYTLAITPKAVLRPYADGQRLETLGVPYGTLPRLILIHIMTEAVRTRSRQVRLGDTLTDWLRKMRFKTVSYGPRGSATLVREQLDRLLACEWMIRWDSPENTGRQEFGIKEIKLTSEYVGSNLPGGGFVREIMLSEAFYKSLEEHAVPLNEHAIAQLRESATALDLYTWLAYRLPRIPASKPTTLSWKQLAVHFGNDGVNIRKFRQTIRDSWEEMVSGVYPAAHVEFDTALIKLFSSPSPLQKLAAPLLKVIDGTRTDDKGTHRGVPQGEDYQPTNRESDTLKALHSVFGPAEARAWLQGATVHEVDGEVILVVANRFKADWIRSKFDAQLQKACSTVGIPNIYITTP